MSAERDRLLELLADRATVGLGAREQIELAELLVQAQDVDIAAFDNAAAAVALAGIGAHLEPMPAALAASVEERALAAMAALHRPASDYQQTRALAQLSPPGFTRTQVDEIIEPAPVSLEERSAELKRTHLMNERPAARTAPPSAPTLTRPGLPYPSQGSAQWSASSAPPPPPSLPAQSSPSKVIAFPPPRSTNVVAVLGWVAAAACLLLAIGAFATRQAGTGPVATVTQQPLPVPNPSVAPTPAIPDPPETAAQLHDKLLAVAGTVRAEWAATKDPGGKSAAGEVLWNKEQQRGTMTFRGLAKNDPSRIQYQLWIFDKTRDDKYPVDGGVFDVDSDTGDVVVAIHAALPVSTPTLFAITMEKPGGVVVSKREHLVLTAKLPAG